MDKNKLRGVQIENICGADNKLSNKILQINGFEEKKFEYCQKNLFI